VASWFIQANGQKLSDLYFLPTAFLMFFVILKALLICAVTVPVMTALL
jgi:hypothetical protein